MTNPSYKFTYSVHKRQFIYARNKVGKSFDQIL